MVNNSSETVNQPSGKQLIATILNLKSENRLYKCLNKVKDEIVKAKIQYTEEVKKENLSHEATFLANEKIISGQKNVIDDLNKQVESLNKQLATTKSSIDDRSKSVETHQSTIQKLSFNLKEAQKYIDDQNYAIDQLRKRLSDCKNDHENHKKALKERFLERIEKAKEEMEVERKSRPRN
ncbi:uncharacterized protein LOC128389799 [Panonychus citri]|uniref:uncharacterized protein LOC128389799 n=1 Tax=Panonychus citri TaxID=50023 RepID=UPI00230816EF|nr:uncharacterized protein LOC128389799 [Panonychus citri]